MTVFQESGQGVFQIGVTFQAAMDGYAVDAVDTVDEDRSGASVPGVDVDAETSCCTYTVKR